MALTLKQLRGRRVAILGAGVEGMAALSAIRSHGQAGSITVLDEKPVDPPAGVSARCGPLATLGLTDFEVVVRSPGISIYRPELRSAQQAGVVFTSGSSLWLASRPAAPVIAVTGTKGKSTTTSVLGHLLRSAGHTVLLGGNLGQPVITFLDQASPDWYVVELSSYQVADLQGRVDIAVLTNLMADHLDWHGDLSQYQRDKLRLLDLASEAVVAHCTAKTALKDRPGVIWAGGPDSWRVSAQGVENGQRRICGFDGWALAGRHNLNNLELALATLDRCSVDIPKALSGLQSFTPLPHRLQPVECPGPVTCINDSIATTPEATVAALDCFPHQPLALIVGGTERQQTWSVLATALRERGRAGHQTRVLIQGQGADRLIKDLSAVAPGATLVLCRDLREAVQRGLAWCPEGGVVLMSPGAPSFDQFDDFRQRGDFFRDLCRAGFSAAV